MEWTLALTIAAPALALAALALAVLALWRSAALGLGMGPRAGPLPERLAQVGRRLSVLESGHEAQHQALDRLALRPALVPYAPLGLGGARSSFVLALLNREGDGFLLNYLAGTGLRLEAKEIRAWLSAGPALTREEEEAVALARRAWASP